MRLPQHLTFLLLASATTTTLAPGLLRPLLARAAPTKCPPPTISCAVYDPSSCPTGQACLQLSDRQPGVCVGRRCGGFTPDPDVCPAGQVCYYPPSNVTDLPGYCLATSVACAGGDGSSAAPGGGGGGDGVVVLRTCPSGWGCVRDPLAECAFGVDPDCGGVCMPPVATRLLL